MKKVENGVCASKGFIASGIHCGIRANKSKLDLGLIVSKSLCECAAVYTTNLVYGAPIVVCREHLKNGVAQAIIVNSGNANTCNSNGVEIANETCKLLSAESGIAEENILIASTGVIGKKMVIDPFKNGMPLLVAGLSEKGSDNCAHAMMTTDTVKKEIAYEFMLGDKVCHIGGIAKGSGMIHPNMATMLAFITTDVSISHELLQKALSEDVVDTFNMVSVDGDTSTNDTLLIMANGQAKNEKITSENEDYLTFKKALNLVTTDLSRKMAKDGEGASKLLECNVYNAKSKLDARLVAKSVICSSLLKAAMFGADANWGRVLCAIGYSKANVDVMKVEVSFKSAKGTILVCKDGAGVDFSEELAKEILLERDININIDLHDGAFNATAYGCDLTYEYVKINGDYRS